jgi:hypothetical protein
MKEGQKYYLVYFKDLAVSTIPFWQTGQFLIHYGYCRNNSKDIEIIANNYMVVPDQLIEAKSQFRVLKDNQYMMPVLELQNIIWETYRCGFNDLFI